MNEPNELLATLNRVEGKLDKSLNRTKCPGCGSITDGDTCPGCGATRDQDGAWRAVINSPAAPVAPNPQDNPVQPIPNEPPVVFTPVDDDNDDDFMMQL